MSKKAKIILSPVLTAFVLLLLISCGSNNPAGPSTKVPVLTTASVSAITPTTAKCGGTITSDGGAAVTARGVCWSTNTTPTVADNKTTNSAGTGTFASSITGLSGNTTYYVRAYATNTAGAGYGDTVSFTTLQETGTLIDIDGNTYQTIKIGNQWWMASNLKATHYRNGDSLPVVTDNTVWGALTTGAYCSPKNNDNNVATYGRFYNWFAVNNSRNIAPAGWHVPSDAEFQTLINYLGGSAFAGGKMKEVGTMHWITPNTGATNESGFFALPADIRTGMGYFGSIGYHALFWTHTANDSINAWSLELAYDFSNALPEYDPKNCGFSIRCIKD